MKSESAISHKIRQVQYRHVKRELRSRFPKGETWDKDEVDQVKAEFREFFAQAPLHEIAREYPDVAALLWAAGARPEDWVPGATLVGKMGGISLWADTPEEAGQAREMIDLLAAAQRSATDSQGSPESPSNGSGIPSAAPQTWWQRWFR